jgi:hypothetical protein
MLVEKTIKARVGQGPATHPTTAMPWNGKGQAQTWEKVVQGKLSRLSTLFC